jgi:hypothetical protein
VFYNGDIVLDKYNEKLIFGDDDDDNCSYRRKRAAARTQSKLWPYGILKYKWASNIGKIKLSYMSIHRYLILMTLVYSLV